MSFWSAYKGLSSRTRLGYGVGLLAWGVIGMTLMDKAESKFGLTPTDEDKVAVEKYLPKILVVDKGSKP